MALFTGTAVVDDGAICNQYKPLVESTVRRLKVPDSLREDAMQEGFIGLLDAIKKYDPKSPVHFSVFARPFVRGAILRRIYTKAQTNETPSGDAREEGSDFDLPPLKDFESSMIELVHLDAWLATLSHSDAWIISRFYWDDATTTEVAEEMGISPRRVNQRHAALLKSAATALTDGD